MSIFRYFLSWLVTLMVCIATGFSLMLVAALIPRAQITPHVFSSCEYLRESTNQPLPIRLVRDNYTDSIMLFMAIEIDEKEPVKSMMKNKWYSTGNFENPTADLYRYLTKGCEGMEEGTYNRYWHGYLVFLRPLLAIIDYSTIRYLNYAIFSTLFLYLAYLIKRYFSTGALMAFMTSMLYASFFFVPQSIQYITTFYIAIIGSILAIRCPWKHWGQSALTCFFVVLGASTSFADFLVTPIITLGFPLTFILLTLDNELATQQIKTVCFIVCAWFLGYAGMWAAKWILCAALTDCRVFSTVCDKLAERSVGHFVLNLQQLCSRTFWFLPDYGKLWWGIIVASCAGIWFTVVLRLYKQCQATFKHHIALLITSFLPFGWFILTYNHSAIHSLFTHRIWSVAIFAFLVFVQKAGRARI